MAHHVIREGRIEACIAERQLLRDVAQLEGDPIRQIPRASKRTCVANAGLVDVDSDHRTAHGFGELQGVPARAASDLQYARSGRELQQSGYLRGLLARHPAGLAEVFAVSGDPHLAIHVGIVMGVGAVVEVDGFGALRSSLV